MKKIYFLTALIMAAAMTACGSEKKDTFSTLAEISSSQESSIQEDNNINAAIGTWIIDYEGDKSELTIVSNNEAYIRTSINANHDFYFDKDKNFICRKKLFTKDDYSFENGNFSLIYQGNDIIEMEKTDGKDDIFGEYRLTGGKYLDIYTDSNTNDDTDFVEDTIMINVSENETIVSAESKLDTFELNNDTIKMNAFKDSESKSAPYRIEGDTLIIITDSGNENILTRKKQR